MTMQPSDDSFRGLIRAGAQRQSGDQEFVADVHEMRPLAEFDGAARREGIGVDLDGGTGRERRRSDDLDQLR